MDIDTIKYDSWSSFKRDYCRDIYNSYSFEKNKCLFRGHGNASWSLTSSFDRRYGQFDWKTKKEIEIKLLDSFRSNCIRNIPNTSIEKMNDIELKSMAQHYGVPTRLLDWSYSPFIAAYFAFSGITNPDTDVAIWVLYKDHELWNSDIGVKIEERLLISNEHQKRQLGCFTVMNTSSNSIDMFVNTCKDNGKNVDKALCRLIIPGTDKKNALLELDAMNINASTVFGGYEGCAKAAEDTITLEYL